MASKFKTLGLMLTTVLALSAAGAPAASAAEFHSAGAPTTITGTQSTSHVFTTAAGTVTCKTATFTGTAVFKTSTEITLTPTYKECTAFGFINVPVDTNGCAYRISFVVEMECASFVGIRITVPGCTTEITTQGFFGMEFSTVGTTPNRTMTMQANVTGLSYNECGTSRIGGTYKGTTTIKGSAGEVWYA